MDELNLTETEKEKDKTLVPYIVSIAGAVILIMANFVKYITLSSLFYTRKASIVQIIMESLNDPETNISSMEDKIIFYMLIAGVIFSVIALLFTVLKKMIPAIIFIILTSLPFLLIGGAWIHYVGALVLLVGAIWYKIVTRKK